MSETMTTLPVAVIGAGPVGLAAAAHLAERGQSFMVFERGAQVGANLRDWAQVRMFSPWQYTVDGAAARLLSAAGWQHPEPEALPTGGDMVSRYLEPLAALPQIAPHLHTRAHVVAISHTDADKMRSHGRDHAPYRIHVAYDDGREAVYEARAVIDATGTWQNPNPLGADGLPAIGERSSAAHIAYGIPDVLGGQRARYANRRVMVVGSGHSAVNALLDLARLQAEAPNTQIVWVTRSANSARSFGGGDGDGLPARAALGTRLRALVESGTLTVVSPFKVRRIEHTPDGLAVSGETPTGPHTVLVDEIIGATGARPNLEMLRELRLDLDSSTEAVRALGPLIDPNFHSCGTVPPHGEAELRQPEKDFYIVGMKSYGRAPTFLLLTGYEQVRSVVAALAGDWEAARQVQLELPETGVCSGSPEDGGVCCGVPTSAKISVLSLGDIRIK